MTTAIDPTSIRLSYGDHASREDGMCLLEAAAYIAGEKHTDHPQCVCPVLAAFGRSWNDGLESDEERDRLLKPLLPKLINTKGSADLASRRSWMALDWLIRVQTPAWMDLTEALRPHAAILRALPHQVTPGELKASAAARDAALDATWDVLRATTWGTLLDAIILDDTARDVLRAAAVDAALAATPAAAQAAARVAQAAARVAQAAAVDAARVAEGAAALDPTKATLKESALELFENMIALMQR